MKILYSGPLGRWSTTEARRRALVDLGHEVHSLDVRKYLTTRPAWWSAVERHVLAGPHVAAYNRDLLRFACDVRPDLVWLDTGAFVRRTTVRKLRDLGAPMLAYNSDYLRYQQYSWRHYLASVPLYDIHVITNQLNVAVLRQLGAKKIVNTLAAFDPDLHRPPQLTAEDRERFDTDVVFLGHCEAYYVRVLAALRRAGLRVRVWGPGWKRRAARGELADALQEPGQLWGPDGVKAMAVARICVGLVSNQNRSESTGRSFEVPAIGSFLLAQRTHEHAALYEEGTEAEFFSDLDELVQKARHYLRAEPERRAIAAAGHKRRWESGGTHVDRVGEILSAI
jgi:spore maturation protein CgeB